MTGRAMLVLAMLWAALPAARAADASATERLMHMADCIRAAGELKGAQREAFMNQCQAKGADASQHMAPTVRALELEQAQPVPATAPQVAEGMPPQERILGCAAGSRDLQGEQRSSYLKQCLAGEVKVPAVEAERARHHAACALQARGQPEAERAVFVDACMNGRLAVPAGGTDNAFVTKVQQDSEPRRRAACNVLAQDRQGTVRKAYIEQCMSVRPAVAPPSAAQTASPLGAKERLVRSQHCADEARARLKEGGQVMAFMNACMAERAWP